MTIKGFAEQVKRDHAGLAGCYIAIMDNDGKYDLEVEVSDASIGGVYATGTSSLEKARAMADELDAELAKLGIRVLRTRNQWDGYLESMEEE